MPPLPPDAAAAALPRWVRKVAGIGLGLVIGAWSLLLIAWLTLHWGILPQVAQWRPEIEARTSAALGVAVRVGDIEVRSRGWVPSLELADVVIHDAQGREALRLPRVAAAVSARSLLAFELRLEQLYIEGAALDVRRGTDGRLRVAGIEVGGAGVPGDAADWALQQHEVVIRNGSLRWTDELLAAPTLALERVDAVLRNGLRNHDLRLDATPPAEWGERFSVRGRFVQPLFARAGDWRRWHGQLHVDLPRADVTQLKRHVALPVEVSAGEGAVRAWIDVADGRAGAAAVDVALVRVSMRLAPDLEPLDFAQVHGRVTGSRDAQGMRLEARRFSFVTAGGMEWPPGDFTVALRWPQLQGPVLGGEFQADRLDLALVAQVAARVPVGAPMRTLLERASPQGVVQGLSLRWDGPPDAPVRYQARGRAVGFGVVAAPGLDGGIGRPGLSNATLDFRADERGGEAGVALDGGALEFPGVFARPQVPFERLAAQLAWRIERTAGAPAAVELRVSNARFANGDGQGELNAVWRTGGRGTARLPGTLDMAGKLAQARAPATARYLPLGIPAGVRSYVEHAVRDGRIVAADFKVKGALSEFPFAGARAAQGAAAGTFRIAGRVEDVTLDYVPSPNGGEPAWPALAGVGGELVFDRTSMQIRNARARLWGLELSPVNGAIRDLVNHPTLEIDGQARGPLADMVRYVNDSPVGAWAGDAWRQAGTAGNGELRLALSLPLGELERSTVRGSVVLSGNDLRLRPDVPLMTQARGRLDFTRESISIVNGSARVLGGEVRFDGGTAADKTLRITARGVASAEAMQRAPELGSFSRVARRFSGQAGYRLQVAVRDGHPAFVLTSALEGLSSDLPAPLGKRADTSMPLRVEVAPVPGTPRDGLSVDLGALVHARFTRDVSGPRAQVLHGGIGVGDAAPTPAAGVHANVNVPNLDADAWRDVLDQWTDGSGSADAGAADGYLPRSIAFRAGELTAGGRRLTGVVAGISRGADEATWRATVEADQLSGYVEMQPSGAAATAGRVYARLARLSIPQQHADSVASLLDAPPATAPALDIVVDDFDLRGRKLGRVELMAANRVGAGGAREWHLSQLAVATPEARLTGSGQWGGPRRRMVLDFQMDMTDSGALVERLGGGRTLKGGRGRLHGQVSWAGSPLSPDVPSMAGQMNLALDAGQFLKAGPGAGRLLSVLSLQSLPRRLVLDFRDVFQEGFAFDNVTGDVTVRDGVARTNNLRMRGVQAAVLMEGSADLQRETQDLRVLVVPEINAGTASLAYAAINPAVGLGTFVAQLLLRRPLMAAGTREFHVTGTWAEPKVDRVQRAPGAPLPDLDPAPAAASASTPARTP